MPWLAVAEFILKLFTGDVWAAWQKHKVNEAINVQNKDASLSDVAAVDELHERWQRR